MSSLQLPGLGYYYLEEVVIFSEIYNIEERLRIIGEDYF